MTASRTMRRPLLAVGAVMLVAACTGDATPATTTTVTQPEATTTLADGEAVPDLADGTEMCARIDQGAVEEALGPLLEPPRIDPMAPTCAFLVNAGIVYVRNLSEPGVGTDEAARIFAEDLEPVRDVATSVEPIADLGDEAVLVSVPDNPPFVLMRSGVEVLNVAGEGVDGDRLVAVARLIEL